MGRLKAHRRTMPGTSEKNGLFCCMNIGIGRTKITQSKYRSPPDRINLSNSLLASSWSFFFAECITMYGSAAKFSKFNTKAHIHSSPSIYRWLNATLKRKCRHFDEIFITGCTGICHVDNFQHSQCWQFHQNEDIPVSMKTMYLQCVRNGDIELNLALIHLYLYVIIFV